MFMFVSRLSLDDLLSDQSAVFGAVAYQKFKNKIAVSTLKKKKKKKRKVKVTSVTKKKPITKSFFRRAKAK